MPTESEVKRFMLRVGAVAFTLSQLPQPAFAQEQDPPSISPNESGIFFCSDLDGLFEPANRIINLPTLEKPPRGTFISGNHMLQTWRDGLPRNTVVFIEQHDTPQRATIEDAYDTDLPDTNATPNTEAGFTSGQELIYVTSVVVVDENSITTVFAIANENLTIRCRDGEMAGFYSSPRFVRIASKVGNNMPFMREWKK